MKIEYDKIIKQSFNDGIVEPVRSTKTSYDFFFYSLFYVHSHSLQ